MRIPNEVKQDKSLNGEQTVFTRLCKQVGQVEMILENQADLNKLEAPESEYLAQTLTDLAQKLLQHEEFLKEGTTGINTHHPL